MPALGARTLRVCCRALVGLGGHRVVRMCSGTAPPPGKKRWCAGSWVEGHAHRTTTDRQRLEVEDLPPRGDRPGGAKVHDLNAILLFSRLARYPLLLQAAIDLTLQPATVVAA